MAEPTPEPVPEEPLAETLPEVEEEEEEVEVEEFRSPWQRQLDQMQAEIDRAREDARPFTARDVTDDEVLEGEKEEEKEELTPQEELVRDAPPGGQSQFGFQSQPAMTAFIDAKTPSDYEQAYRDYAANLVRKREERDKEQSRYAARARETTLSERLRQRGVLNTKAANQMTSHFSEPLATFIEDNYAVADIASSEDVFATLKEAVANKGKIAGTDRPVPGVLVLRKVGELPDWAQREYDSEFAAALARWGTKSLAAGQKNPELQAQMEAGAQERALRRLSPAAKLAWDRQFAEKVRWPNATHDVEEMDARVFVSMNNYAQRDLGVEYDSPEHMIEAFGEDYDLYLESQATSERYLEAAANNLDMNELDSFQNAAEYLKAVEAAGNYVRLAKQMEDADAVLTSTGQEFSDILAKSEQYVEESDEFAQLQKRAEQLDRMSREAAKKYNEAREQLLPLHERVSKAQATVLRLMEKVNSTEAQSGVVGFHITRDPSTKEAHFYYSNKLPYFTDDAVKEAIANTMPWQSAERTLFTLDLREKADRFGRTESGDLVRVDHHRRDFTDATEGFDEIIKATRTEAGREDLVTLYGRRRGEEVVNVYGKLTWPENIRPGDIKVPMGYDPVTGRTVVDLRQWGDSIAYKYFVLEKRRLEEKYLPALEKKYGPRTGHTGFKWTQQLQIIDQEARRVGWEKSRAAVERFRVNQVTARTNFDPDRAFEDWMNAKSVGGAVTLAAASLANWTLGAPQRVLQLGVNNVVGTAAKAAFRMKPHQTFRTYLIGHGGQGPLSPDQIAEMVPVVRDGTKTVHELTEEDWDEYFASDEWDAVLQKLDEAVDEGRRRGREDIWKKHTMVGGIAMQIGALGLKHRQIAGKIEMNQYGEYNVTPGPIAEYLGQRSSQGDVVLRLLGFTYEGIASSYMVAQRQLINEAPDPEAAAREGFGSQLLQRMATLQGDPAVLLNMTETSDSVGPMFKGFSRSLLGTAEEDKYARGFVTAALVVSVVLDPGPLEAVGALRVGTQRLRFQQPIRKMFHMRTVDEMTAAAVDLDTHLRRTFGDWRALPDDRAIELEQEITAWILNSTGADMLARSALVRSIWRNAVVDSGQGASRAGQDHLANVLRRAEEMETQGAEYIGRVEKTMKDNAVVPDETSGALSRAERERIHADLVEDLGVHAHKLKLNQDIVEAQVNTIAELSAYLENLYKLDDLESAAYAQARWWDGIGRHLQIDWIPEKYNWTLRANADDAVALEMRAAFKRDLPEQYAKARKQFEQKQKPFTKPDGEGSYEYDMSKVQPSGKLPEPIGQRALSGAESAERGERLFTSEVVTRVVRALEDVVSRVDEAGKPLSSTERGKRALRGGKILAAILGQDPAFAAQLARLNGRSMDEVLTLISDALNTNRFELDLLAARVKKLWPSAGAPSGMTKSELRAARREVRDQIEDVLENHVKYGAEYSIVATTARINGLRKALIPQIAALRGMQELTEEMLVGFGRLGDNQIVNSDDVQRLIAELDEIASDVGVTVEGLINAKTRALNVVEASRASVVRTQQALRGAVRDHLDVLLEISRDPTLGLRIQRTVDEGVLVDTRGRLLLDEAGQDIRSSDYVKIMEDEGFSRAIDRLAGPAPKPAKGEAAVDAAVQAAYDKKRIEAMRKLMGITNVVIKLFEHPKGKIFKGGVAGLSSYAAELAAESGPVYNAFLGMLTNKRVWFHYISAQFREGGTMYWLRSYFLKQLKVNYVQTSERLNRVTIRSKTLMGKITDDIAVLVRVESDAARRAWPLGKQRATIDGRSVSFEDAMLEAQKRAFRKAMTHRGGVFEVIDVATVGPEAIKARYHLRGLEAADTSLVQDAIHFLVYSAQTDPSQVAAMGRIAGQTDLMNAQPFFYGMTRAFRPDKGETARAAGMSDAEWKALAGQHDNLALDNIIKALSTDAKGKKIPGPIDVYRMDPNEVYDKVYMAIVEATDVIYNYGKPGMAKTRKPRNWEHFHEAMLTTAMHWRAMVAMQVELPGRTTRMAEAANVVLDDAAAFASFSKEPFKVGDQVVRSTKIRRLQNIIGRPITTGEVEEMVGAGLGRVRDPVPLKKSPFDPYRDDISAPRGADAAAKPVQIKQAPEIMHAYKELDSTPPSIIDEIVDAGEKLPDGRTADEMYFLLDTGPEYVRASDFSRMSDYPSLNYLDALDAFVYWALKNADGFLESEKWGKALAMTRQIDTMHQRFVAHTASGGKFGPDPAPANWYKYFDDMTSDFMKTLDDIAEVNPGYRAMGLNQARRTISWIKDSMLYGVTGLRWAMSFVQWFGDVTSLWQTLGTRQTLRAGYAGAIGYLPLPHQLLDRWALAAEFHAVKNGYGWMHPVSFSFMNPTLAKVLTQDPNIKIKVGKRGYVDCKTLYKEMVEDIGATNISSKSTSELVQQAARNSMKRTEVKAAFRALDWTVDAKPALLAKDTLTTMKRQLKNAVATGTERTRGSVWIDQMILHNGNRRIARERLNYGLIDWTTGTSKMDMDILSLMMVFPTFVRGYVRQTGQMLLDIPSSSLGEYTSRLLRGKTGAQRMKAAHFSIKAIESQFLLPDPSLEAGLPQAEGIDYTLRSYYPEYNFDRPMVSFDRVHLGMRAELAAEGFRYSHSYRVLPGIQSLVGLKNIVQLSLLTNAMFSVFFPGRKTDPKKAFQVVDDMIDGVSWGYVSEIIAVTQEYMSKEKTPTSPWGIKLGEGDVALLNALGMSDTWELIEAQDRPRLNLYKHGEMSLRQAMALAIVEVSKTFQVTPEIRRWNAGVSVFDPSREASPFAVREAMAKEEEFQARLEGLALMSGVLPRSYLGLEAAQSYETKALKRTTERISRALDKDISDAKKEELGTYRARQQDAADELLAERERALARERARRAREDAEEELPPEQP